MTISTKINLQICNSLIHNFIFFNNASKNKTVFFNKNKKKSQIIE